jgi:hypothetical protein
VPGLQARQASFAWRFHARPRERGHRARAATAAGLVPLHRGPQPTQHLRDADEEEQVLWQHLDPALWHLGAESAARLLLLLRSGEWSLGSKYVRVCPVLEVEIFYYLSRSKYAARAYSIALLL